MTFDVIPADRHYIGMTRLALEGQRALSCMGVGDDVQRILLAKLEELNKQPYGEEDGR